MWHLPQMFHTLVEERKSLKQPRLPQGLAFVPPTKHSSLGSERLPLENKDRKTSTLSCQLFKNTFSGTADLNKGLLYKSHNSNQPLTPVQAHLCVSGKILLILERKTQYFISDTLQVCYRCSTKADFLTHALFPEACNLYLISWTHSQARTLKWKTPNSTGNTAEEIKAAAELMTPQSQFFISQKWTSSSATLLSRIFWAKLAFFFPAVIWNPVECGEMIVEWRSQQICLIWSL